MDWSNDQRAQEGWAPAPMRRQLPQFMVLKTGFHASVFTYDPQSSFIPLPGPQFSFLISRASPTLRLQSNFFLFLSVMVWTTSKFEMSNGSSHSLQCWVMPLWDQLPFSMARWCSRHRVSQHRRVCPIQTFLHLGHSVASEPELCWSAEILQLLLAVFHAWIISYISTNC